MPRARRVGRVLRRRENQKSEQWCRSTSAGWHSYNVVLQPAQLESGCLGCGAEPRAPHAARQQRRALCQRPALFRAKPRGGQRAQPAPRVGLRSRTHIGGGWGVVQVAQVAPKQSTAEGLKGTLVRF